MYLIICIYIQTNKHVNRAAKVHPDHPPPCARWLPDGLGTDALVPAT